MAYLSCGLAWTAVAIVSAGICAYATSSRNFWLLTAATLLAGYYNANGALYRFAAAELVPQAAKEKAISWVLAGGIIGGVFGPNLASATRDLLPQPFDGRVFKLDDMTAACADQMIVVSFR